MQIRGKHLAVNSKPGGGSKAKPASAPVYQIARTLPSDTWKETEVIQDRDPLFIQREFHPRSKHRDSRVIEAFGTDAPHSGDALLHYAGPPKGEAKKTPVLLVHGANKNGHFFWDPKEDGSDKGLAQRLRDEGHQVYAVTFAHNQDDNFVWAEQIANAIAEIKKDTGAEKVDLVAHSKGGVAARIYTSDVRKEGVESTPYQEDVRRMILVGAPNKGVDYTFRHPSANYALLQDSDEPFLNAPVSWEKMGPIPFFRKDVSAQGYSAEEPDYFPGQRQLLADLSAEHPLSMVEPDWYTTYHGGAGFNSNSKGIKYYVEQGENVIARLNQNPPDSDVEVAVLAGNRANIPGILNEYTGPSDGLVFVDSALTMPEGTNLVAQDVLPLHHKALISDEAGQDWIVKAIEEDRPQAEIDFNKTLDFVISDWQPEKVQEQALAQIAALSPLQDQPKKVDKLILPMV